MDILIIGNGFDLAHKLDTKYTDFLKYCRDYNEENPISDSDEMNKEFLSFRENNGWLKYFLARTPNLGVKKTWIDFEKEIATIIHKFENQDIQIEDINSYNDPETITHREILEEKPFAQFVSSFASAFHSVTESLIDDRKISDADIKLLKNHLYSQLRDFRRAFEIYCLKINSTQIDEPVIASDDYLAMSKFDYILSFNYTNTYERLYGNKKTKYCYIHGKAQSMAEKNNIILGIDDQLSDGKESKEFSWVKFKKYYQRIIFKTGSEYKDWLVSFGKMSNIHHYVHIVGHSLDETDRDVLREFFSSEYPNLRIIVYYYCPDDFEDKVQKVIQLLADKDKSVSGRDELIRRVHGNDWTIKFVDQYDEKKGLFIRN